MRKVVIVGAGLAGLTATLRLLERNYHVTLYEQDDFVGGMMRAFDDPRTGTRREHAYHMYPNWYYNFWKVAEDLGIQHNFSPRTGFRFFYRERETNRQPKLHNPGGAQDLVRNLTSGVAPPADLFLFMYSMIDILGEELEGDGLLDKISVNGFLRGRPYATERMAELHQKFWETVWGVASYNASARSYQTFLKYGNRVPDPQFWLLRGDKQTALLDPWLAKLRSYGERFELCLLHRLDTITPARDGRIAGLTFQKVDKSPSIFRDWKPLTTAGGKPVPPVKVDVADADVIMAVTPGAMANLLTGELINLDPSLGQLDYLEAEPMASIALHFKGTLGGITDDVTALMNTPYQMTFLDYSKVWPGLTSTLLYVTASDIKALLPLEPERRDRSGRLILDLDAPKTAIDYLLQAFRMNVPFEPSDIDLKATSLETNTGEELFANAVGSWRHRPETTCRIPNLFLAGTYVRNFADVSTMEGGVATGVMAAEAVRAKSGEGAEIPLILPEAYPRDLFRAARVALAPYAASAKAWSAYSDTMARLGIRLPGLSDPFRADSAVLQEVDRILRELLAGRPVSGPRQGLGPLYWQDGESDKHRAA
ncbi:MAG: FAD-dependent oxidoreductase [Pseudomonadota bacterium]